jgi:hypothetical protein
MRIAERIVLSHEERSTLKTWEHGFSHAPNGPSEGSCKSL